MTAPRDHTVVIGDTAFAASLAAQLASRGEVVHAGREPLPRAQGGGTPPVEVGYARDPDGLVGLTGAREARLVAIDLDSDAATLGVVAALTSGGAGAPTPQILANLRDPALQRRVDENLHAAAVSPRPRIVSTAAIAAGRAVAALRPWSLADERGQRRVHAVVLGFSDVGRACCEELIVAGIAGEFDKPRLVIVDPDPASVRRLIERDMPEIDVSADIVLAAYDPLTLCAPDGPLAAAADVAPITLIVVSFDDPAELIASMLSITRAQERDGQIVAAAAVVTERGAAAVALARPAGRPGDAARSWSVFGGIGSDPDVLGLVTERVDVLPKRIHDVYCARYPGPANRPWEELPETFRKSNRSAAAHMPVKLWTLGLREPGGSDDPFAVDPHTVENVIKPCVGSTSEDAIVRRLSRLEHDRWCAERRLDGWRFGEPRADARRIHDKLIPFDDPRLTEADIDKDADQVRLLFGELVTAAEDGAVTPLVVGIVASLAEAGGIAVPAALALCRKEPWRPIVVVSALLDATECRLARELTDRLDRDGLSWRLLVPEITLDNRELRTVTEPEDKSALAALLGRPSTRFAAIGAAVAPADLWADPSAPDPHADAIASYIAERAAAIVVGGDDAFAAAGDAAS